MITALTASAIAGSIRTKEAIAFYEFIEKRGQRIESRVDSIIASRANEGFTDISLAYVVDQVFLSLGFFTKYYPPTARLNEYVINLVEKNGFKVSHHDGLRIFWNRE